MGAHHTLDNTGDMHMRLAGHPDNPGPHCLELYEAGGQMFLLLTLDGRNPGGGLRSILLPLSVADARQLAHGVRDLLAQAGHGSVL